MSKEWDKENMRTLGVNLKKETAEKFKEYAKANDTTVGALLRGFIESTVSGVEKYNTPTGGYAYLISYKLEDKLKHETAFHNPGHLSPPEMLEYILNDYFKIAEHFRRKGK